jgi:hypothetical protein
MSYRHVSMAGDNSQVKNVLDIYNIHLVSGVGKAPSHALVFLKIDVMGIITAISGVGKTQTSMRQGETDKRNVTIHLPGLAAPISC